MNCVPEPAKRESHSPVTNKTWTETQMCRGASITQCVRVGVCTPIHRAKFACSSGTAHRPAGQIVWLCPCHCIVLPRGLRGEGCGSRRHCLHSASVYVAVCVSDFLLHPKRRMFFFLCLCYFLQRVSPCVTLLLHPGLIFANPFSSVTWSFLS